MTAGPQSSSGDAGGQVTRLIARPVDGTADVAGLLTEAMGLMARLLAALQQRGAFGGTSAVGNPGPPVGPPREAVRRAAEAVNAVVAQRHDAAAHDTQRRRQALERAATRVGADAALEADEIARSPDLAAAVDRLAAVCERLLSEGGIPAVPSDEMASASRAGRRAAALGRAKLEVCRRLDSDWQDLADYFQVHPRARGQFGTRGPQGVWEWLEQRGRLPELPDGLREIGRPDLVETLRQFGWQC